MKKYLVMAMMALVVLSCSNAVVSSDEYNGYVYDGNKLVKYVSENNDTVVWYDWSPSELMYIGDGRYVYMGYPCVVDFDDHADVFSEMDDLETIQWMDDNGQYSDTYYDLLSVFSPVWIESEQRYTLYHW